MTEFNLMTWNVQNLFHAGHEQGPRDPQVFDRKISLLAAAINKIRPDLLALQEVGTEEALNALQNALDPKMPSIAIAKPDARGIRVAYLSKLPFTDTVRIPIFRGNLGAVQVRDPVDNGTTLSNELSREALEVIVTVDQRRITVINTHFKSKLLTFPRPSGAPKGAQFTPKDETERARYAAYALFRRTGEAVTVRTRVNELLQDANEPGNLKRAKGRDEAVIVCGDLNDEVHAATTQILQGPPGSEIGTIGYDKPDEGDGIRLWNLAPMPRVRPGEASASAPFTRRFAGRGELIDHVLASHALAGKNKVFTWNVVQAKESLPDMNEMPQDVDALSGSDHAAIAVKFSW